MGMCALTSNKAHPPWKVWAHVHYTVAVHLWEMYSFNFTNILVMSKVHRPFLNMNCSHYYSSKFLLQLTMPVRVMKLLGVTTLVVTNAAGGLNSEYHIGDVMIMKDHINLVGMAGFNPLIGTNEDR